uniref:DUF5024 domain-containing protein n=1 Tax=Prevotella sp. TaxID=59823 RepID=UPI004024FA22
MRTIHCIAACLLAMTPLFGQAQEKIEKMKDVIMRQNGVATTNETEKDPQTLDLRSLRETYRFTVKKNSDLIQITANAFDQDAAKAYSVFKGDGESLASAYNVGGVYIGKGYDHFVLECFADKDNPNRRYAYALEWNEAKSGKITGKLTKVYGKRPDSITATSVTKSLPSIPDFHSIKKVAKRLHVVTDGTLSNEQIDSIINSVIRRLNERGYKDIASMLQQEWQTAEQSEKNDARAVQTIVYDKEKNFMKRYRNGQILIVDGEGNIVFTGLKGKLVMDNEGNIVATNYSGKTVVISND